MKKLTFKSQLFIGIAITILGFILSTIFKKSIIANIGVVIYGLLFVINPIFPVECESIPKMVLYTRLTGIVIIIIGLISRFGV